MIFRYSLFCTLISAFFFAIPSGRAAAPTQPQVPIATVGDFYQIGTDQIALIIGTTWYLPDPHTLVATVGGPSFQMPEPGQPVIGDWNGDGKDTPGVFTARGEFQLASQLSGSVDIVFQFGQLGDIPVVGDWNGDGIDTVGVYRAGSWYLTNTHSTNGALPPILFGNSADYPVAGDWDNDGDSTIGIYAGGLFTLSDDLFGFVLSYVPLSHWSGGLPVTFHEDPHGDGVALVVNTQSSDGGDGGKIIIRPNPE